MPAGGWQRFGCDKYSRGSGAVVWAEGDCVWQEVTDGQAVLLAHEERLFYCLLYETMTGASARNRRRSTQRKLVYGLIAAAGVVVLLVAVL